MMVNNVVLLLFCAIIFTITFNHVNSHAIIRAIIGSTGRLPCNVSQINDDTVQLVLWYKTPNATGPPFYTLDNRATGKTLSKAKHFVSPGVRGRCLYDITKSPSLLTLENVNQHDSGIYSCRVDYKWSRTSINTIALDVIVPPKDVIITDLNSGQRLKNLAGPYSEGSDINLRCSSADANPLPKLKWFIDSDEVNDTSYRTDNNLKEAYSDIKLKNITRAIVDSVITCSASIVDLVPQVPVVSSSIRLDLILKPTQVSIISHTSSPLKSGKKYDVICQSKGSKPPATISWYLRHKLLKTSRSSDSPDGKITTSVLNYVATAEDHGQLIVCMASNPRDSISHLNDTLLLDIHYRPKLSLRMATNDTNGTTPGATAYPLEGQEAILNCDTKSNPNATQMYWLHNGLPVRADKDSGLFVNGQQLVLRTVLRSVHNGDYQCVASNSEGTARSNILTLSVHYAPTCEEKNKKVYYEISPGEPLTIACAMRASHGVNFSWTYQPIGETNSRRLTNFTIQNGLQGDSSIFVSSLLVSIDHEADYGKYVCLSRNNYGQGSCEYLLQPKLGPPEAPSACHLSVQVQDGGQVIHMVTCDTYNSTDPLDKISYHLEVFDAERKVLLKEVDNLSDPHFLISGLSAEDKHVFVISSRDDNGHSKEYILSTSTAKSLVSTTHAHDGQDGNHRNDNETGSTLDSHLLVLVVVGGLLLTLTMLAIIKVTLVCQHKNIISSQRNGNNHDGHPSSESLNKSMNPDVIPLNIESLAALGLPADYSADYSILTNGQRYDVSTIQWLPDDNDDHIIDQSEMQIKNYISAAVDKTQLHENYDLFEDTIFITEEYVDNSQDQMERISREIATNSMSTQV